MYYIHKKAMSIGIVSELTGLTERQIRYYEERSLVSPERTSGGTRRYSFADVEKLISITRQMGDHLSPTNKKPSKKIKG